MYFVLYLLSDQGDHSTTLNVILMIIYTRAQNSQRFCKTDFSTQSVESLFVSSLFPTIERSPLNCVTSYGPKFIFVTEEEYKTAHTQALINLGLIIAPQVVEAAVLALDAAPASSEDPHKDLPF